jgi:predicted PurR-regulated permease PerM
MTSSAKITGNYRKAFVLMLTLAVCVAFAILIKGFLLAVLLAAIFSTLLHPVYLRLQRFLHAGPAVTSGLVIFILAIAIGIPLFALAGLAAAEALAVSEAVSPWLREHIYDGGALAFKLPAWLPFSGELEPYKTQILEKTGELAGGVGQFLFNSISDATRGTFGALLNIFIFGYALFFFLKRGPELVDSALRYLPLNDADRARLIERGLTVTKATLKSILIIGLLQGTLIGLAFWVLGIGGAVFWGTTVLILSAIPGLGSVIVWAPAAGYLVAIDQPMAALGLTIWGALIVGLVDNILRPRLVGGEARIPDLLILLSVLGGIGAFGVVGIVVGPIMAAVFFTVLDIYQSAFVDLLPEHDRLEGSADGPDDDD